MIGIKFGRWLVVSLADPYVWTSPCGSKKQTHTRYNCVCDCGEKRAVRAGYLMSGTSLSCGCLSREICAIKATKHGKVGSREHNAWVEMKRRCLNESFNGYEYYGGRGITVQESWVTSFNNFYEYMGDCPSGYTLERIDVEKGYEEGNVMWASYST